MLMFIPLLLVVALPFVATVAIAARVSEAKFPRAAAPSSPLFFTAILILTALIWRRVTACALDDLALQLGSLLLGSCAALPAIWLVMRARVLLLVPGAAVVVACFVFRWFERGTHGPWYMRSEGLAILLSIAVGAAVWHAIVAAALLVWARTIGRRERRVREGRCPGCGYTLAGLTSGSCPECGRTVTSPAPS